MRADQIELLLEESVDIAEQIVGCEPDDLIITLGEFGIELTNEEADEIQQRLNSAVAEELIKIAKEKKLEL